MNLGIEGKVAVVTGGTGGIGAAVAGLLATEGCDVAVVDRRTGDAADHVLQRITSAGRKGHIIEADVTSLPTARDALQEVSAQLGRFDILVCSAGITSDKVLWKMTEDQWDTVIDVNLKGCFNYNRVAAEIFRETGNGKIVNISSINGLRGKFSQTNYAASKAGVIGLTKSLARELGRFNVNVNAVAPGMVMTDMVQGLPEQVQQAAVEETALGRLATPEDCAGVVVFLCSEQARHITGAVIQVDGGQYM